MQKTYAIEPMLKTEEDIANFLEWASKDEDEAFFKTAKEIANRARQRLSLPKQRIGRPKCSTEPDDPQYSRTTITDLLRC